MVRLWRLVPRFRALALVLCLVGCASALGGCEDEDFALIVTGVQPFYTTQDLTSDAALAGTWQSEDEVAVSFEAEENNAYTVVVTENADSKSAESRFEGHLFRLGNDSFLDLHPLSSPDAPAFYLLHFFPCHAVAKVEFAGDRLELTFLNATWLLRQLKTGAVSIAHAKSGDILLLTASTQETQELLFLHASDEGAFTETLSFDRAQGKEAK